MSNVKTAACSQKMWTTLQQIRTESSLFHQLPFQQRIRVTKFLLGDTYLIIAIPSDNDDLSKKFKDCREGFIEIISKQDADYFNDTEKYYDQCIKNESKHQAQYEAGKLEGYTSKESAKVELQLNTRGYLESIICEDLEVFEEMIVDRIDRYLEKAV